MQRGILWCDDCALLRGYLSTWRGTVLICTGLGCAGWHGLGWAALGWAGLGYATT